MHALVEVMCAYYVSDVSSPIATEYTNIIQRRMQDFLKGDSVLVSRAKILEATPTFD